MFLAGKNHAERRAEIHGGQRPGIAVVQEVCPVRNQLCAMKAHTPVDIYILVGQRLGFGQQQQPQVRHNVDLAMLG